MARGKPPDEPGKGRDSKISPREDLFVLPAGYVLDRRYRVVRSLGAGAVGSVFEAHDESTGATVAIKVLRPSLMGSPEFLERFRREAAATTKIRHPNIVDVIDFGKSHDGIVYLVMELLAGHDLAEELERTPLPPPAFAVEVTTALLGALWVAHDAGVVHRDIKPANIFLWEVSGHRAGVKVVDFGMAQDSDEKAGLTKVGAVVGTPLYMAPEQAKGEKVDARADLYAAGCVAYELFCGRPPLIKNTPYLIMLAHVEEVPQLPSEINPLLPPSVDKWLMRALEKQADKRYQTASQMFDMLSTVAEDLGLRQAQFYEPTRSLDVSVRVGDVGFAPLPAQTDFKKTQPFHGGAPRDTIPAPPPEMEQPAAPRELVQTVPEVTARISISREYQPRGPEGNGRMWLLGVAIFVAIVGIFLLIALTP